MELGQRLKQARLEAGLSQRQLCGDEITRNMLSQIENGSARPSMTTLGYLARQLGKPVSYFLEEDAVRSPNQQTMEQARQDYNRGNYFQVLATLEDYNQPDPVFDPERYLLEALSLMALARQVSQEGKPVYAKALLEKASQAAGKTPYYTPALERERILLLSAVDAEECAELVQKLPEDHREQYLRVRGALESGAHARAAALLDGMPDSDHQWHFLRGQAAQAQGDHALAAGHYLQAEHTYPKECAKALENCYRELEDYKQAYYYACKQREE